MAAGDPILELQAFIDERWAVAQPRFYPASAEPPRVQPEVTPKEAEFFLAAVTANGGEPPLFRVDDERTMRSDRYPPRDDGTPAGYLFFEEPGRLRLETIVHIAAAARLRDEFGWPRDHLVFGMPEVLYERAELGLPGLPEVVHERGEHLHLLHLQRDALDMLLLEVPCAVLSSKMPVAVTRSRIAVEAKATPKLINRLLWETRACQMGGAPDHAEHEKCLALRILRPRLFLAVAASETRRLFPVVERNGHVLLGDELPDLQSLRF